jgi:prolyl oligopeptidase
MEQENRKMVKLAVLVCAAAMLLSTAVGMRASVENDPHLWLEEIEGTHALEWVRAQNARSLATLEAEPAFESLKNDALAILTSQERIPLGQIRHGQVYNFWQDADHVRGLWRRASLESYRSGRPAWETLIDYDALARAEGRNWLRGAVSCLSPEYRHCMVQLSDGGTDAAYWREFDTSTKQFVDNGFSLPEAKSRVAWIDRDTLLIGMDTGPDSLTTSGYPRKLRVWARGGEYRAAPIFVEGAESDVAVWPRVEQDNGTAHVFGRQAVTFFESRYHYAPGAGGKSRVLPLPPNADLEGVLDGRAIFTLRENWSHGGREYVQGSVIAYALATDVVSLVFRPQDHQAVGSVGIGNSNIVIQYLEDVAGRAARFSVDRDGVWSADAIALPGNGVVKLVSAGGGTDAAMLSFESLTTPTSLLYVDARNQVSTIAKAPAFYDASDVIVEQRFATSADGTRVPYFVMGRKDVLAAGNAPTVQYGYGGFLAPVLPVYYEDPSRPQHGALAGRLWVSRGGVLVLSNIRGGGEYGPRWHQAALKENRQRSFDDFIAISKHLIETGATTAARLGAIGRSNGGLLMGAIMTQRPELYAAIVNGVPLFDMRRYHKLLAGASWMGEFGNPDDPEEWAYISRYSPYQKLEAGRPYPKVFIYTSTKDDRVHPGHARKAAARLAELGYDYLYFENIEGGHGGTANQEQLAHRIALEYAYFTRMLMGEASGERRGGPPSLPFLNPASQTSCWVCGHGGGTRLTFLTGSREHRCPQQPTAGVAELLDHSTSVKSGSGRGGRQTTGRP